MSKNNPFENPRVVIKENEDRDLEEKVELDEIREQDQIESDELLKTFEVKKEEFPKDFNRGKNEYFIARDELDERYANPDTENTDEFIDSIDEKKENEQETYNEIVSTNKNFIPGEIGKKIAKIKSKFFVTNERWAKMTEEEKKEFKRRKQEETNNLFIHKNGKK